jgi:hypothetical protein
VPRCRRAVFVRRRLLFTFVFPSAGRRLHPRADVRRRRRGLQKQHRLLREPVRRWHLRGRRAGGLPSSRRALLVGRRMLRLALRRGRWPHPLRARWALPRGRRNLRLAIGLLFGSMRSRRARRARLPRGALARPRGPLLSSGIRLRARDHRRLSAGATALALDTRSLETFTAWRKIRTPRSARVRAVG